MQFIYIYAYILYIYNIIFEMQYYTYIGIGNIIERH